MQFVESMHNAVRQRAVLSRREQKKRWIGILLFPSRVVELDAQPIRPAGKNEGGDVLGVVCLFGWLVGC